MAEEQSGDDPWLTVAGAARRLGVSPRAIRGRIRRGTIEWKAAGNTGKLVRVPEGDPPGDADSVRDDVLDELRDELMHTAVAQARAEERAKVLAEVIEELRAQLAWHRQPWWRRLW